jgi:hypothetical protein
LLEKSGVGAAVQVPPQRFNFSEASAAAWQDHLAAAVLQPAHFETVGFFVGRMKRTTIRGK